MKHCHENIDLNSDFKLITKPSSSIQSNNFKQLRDQISNQSSNSDYSQDDYSSIDPNIDMLENNETEETQQKQSINNEDIYSHGYKKEIMDFVNRAAKLYSEENIMFLQKELNNKGLILSFQPPTFRCWQCVICSDNPKNPIVFPCGHIFCQQCVNEWSKHSNFCPICHTQLDKENAIEIRSFLDTSPKKK